MSWLSPYAVSIPEAELDDLARGSPEPAGFDDFPETAWDLGVSCVYLRELCEYWRTTFDWRAQESLLNSYSQYMVDVDGQSIHFVHARSARRDALPLLLIHGWPGSVFEYIKVLDPLSRPLSFGADAADSFHVVTPSIPGYGFSGPTGRLGWGPASIAAAFATLMHRLGYERYAVAGGDWGAIIGTELAGWTAESTCAGSTSRCPSGCHRRTENWTCSARPTSRVSTTGLVTTPPATSSTSRSTAPDRTRWRSDSTTPPSDWRPG